MVTMTSRFSGKQPHGSKQRALGRSKVLLFGKANNVVLLYKLFHLSHHLRPAVVHGPKLLVVDQGSQLYDESWFFQLIDYVFVETLQKIDHIS